MADQALVLVILDGWGDAPAWGGNAIQEAHTPFVHQLWQAPTAKLAASGEAVGLQPGSSGNSEVGHLNLGSGRVPVQHVTRIDQAIVDQRLSTNQAVVACIREAQAAHTPIHLIGLLSRATVHAATRHLEAILRTIADLGQPTVFLHPILDGRDSDPHDGLNQIIQLEQLIEELGIGTIATVSGRYYAMDRDHHWERTQLAYRAIMLGEGDHAVNAKQAVAHAYSAQIGDEFIRPTVVGSYSGTGPGSTGIFWNFRPDRARQLTQGVANPDFREFPRERFYKQFLTLTNYAAGANYPYVQVAFPEVLLTNTLAEVISRHGGRQFHIAETEKYPHVTYFFNGGREEPFPGEERELIPSQKVATYDQAPAMSAAKITNTLIGKIKARTYQLLVANYANADMVGHTGNYQAALEAVETIDAQLFTLAKICQKQGVPLVVTADHGNVEQMVNPVTGEPATNHTANPVPCHFVMPHDISLDHPTGMLADVAPTICSFLGLPIPTEMTGRILAKYL